MFGRRQQRTGLSIFALWLASMGAIVTFRLGWGAVTKDPANEPRISAEDLQQRFSNKVQPFLQRYCISCHDSKKQKGMLDLSRDSTITAIVKNPRRWQLILERLQS